MKKTVTLILALLYLGITTGVVANIHYCMGNVAFVDYGFDKGDVCGKCGMKKESGCCHTDHKIVKVQDAHQLAQSGFEITRMIAEVPNEFTSSITGCSTYNKYFSLNYHSPPDKRIQSIHLFNCIFRL
jgi:hypothetical protein